MKSSRHSFGGISGRCLLEKRTIFVCIRLLYCFGRQNGFFFRATGRGAAVWGLWRNWSGFVVFFHKNVQKLVYVRKKV